MPPALDVPSSSDNRSSRSSDKDLSLSFGSRIKHIQRYATSYCHSTPFVLAINDEMIREIDVLETVSPQ